MKKLLVVLLALTFVVAMATAAFAVTTSSVDGKVEVSLSGNTNAEGHVTGTVDGKLSFDLAKDYGEGYKAGLKIKITPNDADEVIYDGAGWIEITKDYAVITVSTGINGNAANELGGKQDMITAPGVKVVNTSLVDGLTLTAIFNENLIQYSHDPVLPTDPMNVGEFWNYLVKAAYAKDALTVGFGYQAATVPAINETNAKNDAMAVWAGYTISDAMSAGVEYASRPNVDADGATAIKAKFGYTADPLTVNALLITKGTGWVSEDTDAWDFFKKFMNDSAEGSLIQVDATYKIGDAFSVYGKVQNITETVLPDDNMMIKVGATYKLSDSISVDGSYSTRNTAPDATNKIDVCLTDTLVAGLVASLDVNNETCGASSVSTYTAKITATL